jgi:hypothetical protein
MDLKRLFDWNFQILQLKNSLTFFLFSLWPNNHLLFLAQQQLATKFVLIQIYSRTWPEAHTAQPVAEATQSSQVPPASVDQGHTSPSHTIGHLHAHAQALLALSPP